MVGSSTTNLNIYKSRTFASPHKTQISSLSDGDNDIEGKIGVNVGK